MLSNERILASCRSTHAEVVVLGCSGDLASRLRHRPSGASCSILGTYRGY